MKNRFLFTVLVALVMVFTACESLQDMMKAASKVEYNVSPKVLTAKAGKVSFELKGSFPAKFFAKTATLEVTPVIKLENGEEVALESYKLQGEEVVGNAKIIKAETGGTFAHNVTFDFENKMRKSELFVKVKGTMGEEQLDFPEIKVADGIKATSTLAQADPKTVFIEDKYVRTTNEKFESDVHYKIQQSSISRKESKSEDMQEFAKVLKSFNEDSRKQLKNISLLSYASPDGSLKLNTRLTQNREKAANRILKRDIKKAKLNLEEGQVAKQQVAEDWEGFKKELLASDIQDKNLIVRVLEMYADPEKREEEIKNIAVAYKELADEVLPKLRRTRFVVQYDLVGKSDEEILAAIAANEELDAEALLQAESVVKENAEKIKINEMVIAKFPKDIRGYNNLAICHIADKNYTKAADALTKAIEASPANKSLFNNLGAVYMLNGEKEKAATELGKAQNSSPEAYYNGAIISLRNGDYANAASNFGQWQTFNAALANYLNGDADRALKILKNVKETPESLYLTAVVASFKNDNDLMFSSLLKATEADAKYKEMARTDVEFASFFNDDKFKAITQ